MPRRRELWLAVGLALMVLLGRTLLIALAHSESFDDQYHLARGLATLERYDLDTARNDPPLGEALLALPMWLTGPARTAEDPWDRAAEPRQVWLRPLHHHRLSPDTLLILTNAWKALLTVPLAAVVFIWVHRLYGRPSAWLALGLLLVEPTFAAHTATVGLDVPGVAGIVLACYLTWQYLAVPTRGRLVAAGVATIVAMLIKHTAIILPGILFLYALMAPRPGRDSGDGHMAVPGLRGRFNRWAAVMLVALAGLWPLTFFDVSPPDHSGRQLSATYTERWSLVADVINPLAQVPLPAGVYLGSIMEAISHGREGHHSFFNGEYRYYGWWYYFPVLMTYKVPLGIGVVLALGLLSLAWHPPRWDEWPLVIGLAGWAAFIIGSGICIGFRHFLPVYIFMLMLAARTVAGSVPRWATILAWTGVAAAAAHALSYHPDYHAYLNWPRATPFRNISYSNLDWGQSLKQVRRWLDAHQPQRPVYLANFLPHEYDLEGRVIPLPLFGADPLPDHGLLILSPALLNLDLRYVPLMEVEPIAIIGHTMRVYDLDRLPPDVWPGGADRGGADQPAN